MQNLFGIRKSKMKDKVQSRRKSRTIYLALLVTVFTIGIVFTFRRITRHKFQNAAQQLERIVADIVKSNEQIKNCVLYVATGDCKFAWSGAASIANQGGQINTFPLQFYIGMNYLSRDELCLS